MKTFIVRSMNTLKAGTCDYLNRISKNMSIKKLKVYWLFFVLVSIAISLEICVQAIRHAKPLEGFSPQHTTVLIIPRSLPDFKKERFGVLLSKIRVYKLYLDSISLVDTTKYRALLKARPYLRDSLVALETFLSQNLIK